MPLDYNKTLAEMMKEEGLSSPGDTTAATLEPPKPPKPGTQNKSNKILTQMMKESNLPPIEQTQLQEQGAAQMAQPTAPAIQPDLPAATQPIAPPPVRSAAVESLLAPGEEWNPKYREWAQEQEFAEDVAYAERQRQIRYELFGKPLSYERWAIGYEVRTGRKPEEDIEGPPLTLEEARTMLDIEPKPFLGDIQKVKNLTEVWLAKRGLDKHKDKDYPHRDLDEFRMYEYQHRQKILQNRGMTNKAKIALGALGLLPYMTAFWASGGLAAGAQVGKKKLMAKAAERYAGKKVRGALAKTGIGLLGSIAEAGARLPAFSQYIGAEYLQERIAGEKPSTAVFKATSRVLVMVFSEQAGGTITKAGKGIISKIPGIKKLAPALQKTWMKATGKSGAEFARRVTTELGVHSLIGELGEEQLEATLLAATGLERRSEEDNRTYITRVFDSLMSLEELGVAATVLAIPTAARAGGAIWAGRGKPPAPSPPTAEPPTPAAQPAAAIPEPIAKPPAVKPTPESQIAKDLGLSEQQLNQLTKNEKAQSLVEDYTAALKARDAELIGQAKGALSSFMRGRAEVTKQAPGEVEVREPAPAVKPTPAERIAEGEGMRPGFAAVPEKPATRKQKALAHILANQQNLSDEEYRKIAIKATGKGSMVDMSSEEAARLIDTLQPKQPPAAKKAPIPDQPRIRAMAGSEDNYQRVMDYAEMVGGMPAKPSLQRPFVRNLEIVARKLAKQGRRATGLAGRGKEANVLNVWSSARYAMAEAEVRSGLPLQKEFTSVVHKSTAASQKAQGIIEGALKKAGTTPFKLSMTRQQSEQIADWLFEENAEQRAIVWGDMEKQTRQIAQELHNVLQNESANEIRELRWRIWDRIDRRIAGKVAEVQERLDKAKTDEAKEKLNNRIIALQQQVKDVQPPNAPDTALTEGRKAYTEGKIKEWAASQTWGTRKHYYMSEREMGDLVAQNMPIGASETIEEIAKPGAGAAPRVRVPGTETREGKPLRLRSQSAVNAVLSHLERAMVANATADNLEILWDYFGEANPSRADIANMRQFMATALGRTQKASIPTAILRTFNRMWWRFYFVRPTKAVWYFTRNIIQNVFGLPSQVPLTEILKGAGRSMVGKTRSPWMGELFHRDWRSKISQKRQISRQFLLLEEGNIRKEAGNRAAMLMDVVGSASIYSDELNRMGAWPILHQAAYDQSQLFAAKKIGFETLRRRLRLGALHVAQEQELIEFLDKNNLKEFVSRYAEMKVENIHYRYETPLRSAAEQTPAGRTFIGLMTFPRGTFEIGYQNGVKPVIQGLRSGDAGKAWQGMATIISFLIGAVAANKLTEIITGKTAYDILDTIFRYTPLTPGASKLIEAFDTVQDIQWRAENQGWDTTKTADAIVTAVGAQLEEFIVGADVYLNIYETANDVAGVRLWRLVKKKLLSKYHKLHGKPFRKTDRTTLEKIRHIVYGGDELGAKPPPSTKGRRQRRTRRR